MLPDKLKERVESFPFAYLIKWRFTRFSLTFIDKKIVLYYKAQLRLTFNIHFKRIYQDFFMKLQLYKTIVDFRIILYY